MGAKLGNARRCNYKKNNVLHGSLLDKGSPHGPAAGDAEGKVGELK